MKLPEMQYRQVQAPRTIGPQAAVVEYQQKQNILGEVQRLGAEVAKQKVEYDTNKANANYADSISQFKRDMATKVDFTPQEIRDMGLDDRVDVANPETGEDYASIPKYKVYSIALQERMQQAKEEYGANIASRPMRDAWSGAVDDANRDELDRSIIESAEMAQEYELSAILVDVKNAADSGQYQTARDLLAKNPSLLSVMSPAEIDKLKDQVTSAEAGAGFNDKLASMGVIELQEYSKYLRSDEANAAYGTMTDKELNTWADRFDSMATNKENEARIKNDREIDAAGTAYFHQYREDPVGMAANIQPWMPPQMVKSFESYAAAKAKGVPIKTDINAYRKLKFMAMTNPTEFVNNPKYSVAAHSNDLDQGDFDELMEMQINAAKSDFDYATSLQTNTALRTQSLRILGIDDKKEPEKAYWFDKVAQEVVDQQAAAVQRKLTPQEVGEVYTKLTGEAQGDQTWWSTIASRFGAEPEFETKNIYEVIDDLEADNAEVELAIRVLGEKGMSITPQSLQMAIENYRKKVTQ